MLVGEHIVECSYPLYSQKAVTFDKTQSLSFNFYQFYHDSKQVLFDNLHCDVNDHGSEPIISSTKLLVGTGQKHERTSKGMRHNRRGQTRGWNQQDFNDDTSENNNSGT